MMVDLISRQAAIDMLNRLADDPWNANANTTWSKAYGYAAEMIEELPSAEPQQWHVLSRRPMDEDERKEWSERLGYDIEYDDAFIYSNLPDDGEEVIICTHSGYVCTDIYYDDDGSYFDNHDLDEVIAWMPLPEPWKGAEDG